MLALLVIAFALMRAPHTPAPATTWSAWPASGTVTSPYGDDAGRWHPGIDIGILRSLAVRAAQPGRVLAVGQRRGFEGYGNVVEIAVGGGYTALYAHLAGWRVLGRRRGRGRAADRHRRLHGLVLRYASALRATRARPPGRPSALPRRLEERRTQVGELLLQVRRHLLDGRLADEAT